MRIKEIKIRETRFGKSGGWNKINDTESDIL